MKILLVEPDKVLSATTQRALKQQGNQVVCCRNAQGAIDAIDTDQPDVIILELQLGLHNGVELLYELRSYPEWQNIPVVVHTLNRRVIEPRFVETLTQLGVQAVFYKPDISPQQLRLKLNHIQLV